MAVSLPHSQNPLAMGDSGGCHRSHCRPHHQWKMALDAATCRWEGYHISAKTTKAQNEVMLQVLVKTQQNSDHVQILTTEEFGIYICLLNNTI